MSSRQITRGETRLRIVAETYATASRETSSGRGPSGGRLPGDQAPGLVRHRGDVVHGGRAARQRRLMARRANLGSRVWACRVCPERPAHRLRRRPATTAKLSCVYDFIDDPLGIFKDDPDWSSPAESGVEPRPRTLGSVYLFEAIDAIRDAGSTDTLYKPAVRAAAPRAREGGWVLLAQHDAAEQRIRFSRNAMLFAAFAAEAYVNEFNTQRFGGKDYEAVEKLSTVDKYVLAPRLALGRELFPRDREPLQRLRALFKHRDMLVHPKPEKGLPDSIRATGYPRVFEADPVYNPREAAAMVVAVAQAADTLVREGQLGSGFDAHAYVVIRGRAALERYASAATKGLPAPDAPPQVVPVLADA